MDLETPWRNVYNIKGLLCLFYLLFSSTTVVLLAYLFHCSHSWLNTLWYWKWNSNVNNLVRKNKYQNVIITYHLPLSYIYMHLTYLLIWLSLWHFISPLPGHPVWTNEQYAQSLFVISYLELKTHFPIEITPCTNAGWFPTIFHKCLALNVAKLKHQIGSSRPLVKEEERYLSWG